MGTAQAQSLPGSRMGVEVTQGVFDPRNYKNTDPNWARKRKPEWLSFPGVIKYTRERTVPDGNVWWDEAAKKEEEEKKKNRRWWQKEKKPEDDELIEVPIAIDGVCRERPVKTTSLRKEPEDVWPRKKRSDITALIEVR